MKTPLCHYNVVAYSEPASLKDLNSSYIFLFFNSLQTNKANKRMASVSKVADIGRVKKIKGFLFDMISDCINACSNNGAKIRDKAKGPNS